MLVEPGEQQVPPSRPQATFLVTGKQPPALGNQIGIGILDEQLAEPEAGQGIVDGFENRFPEPGNSLFTPSEERQAAAELVGSPRRRLLGGGRRRFRSGRAPA